MQIERVDIKKLKPHPANPRVHPESAIKQLERSIKEYGWTNPVLVSEDGYVLAGHARIKAAKRLGVKEVPIIRLPLKGAKATAYLIADNRLSEESRWDYDILEDVFDRLLEKGIELEITGFNEAEYQGMVQEVDYESLLLEVGEGGSKPSSKKLSECPYCGYEF
jgi:ParB-like chromosome segregation protein Spo0J